jgi:hypothetical protein
MGYDLAAALKKIDPNLTLPHPPIAEHCGPAPRRLKTFLSR